MIDLVVMMGSEAARELCAKGCETLKDCNFPWSSEAELMLVGKASTLRFPRRARPARAPWKRNLNTTGADSHSSHHHHTIHTPPIDMASEAPAPLDGQLQSAAAPPEAADSAPKPKRSWR